MDTLSEKLRNVGRFVPASELRMISTCGPYYKNHQLKHPKAIEARKEKKEFHKKNYHPWRDAKYRTKPKKGE